MTDLHTHILPGLDDGPKDMDSALELLEQQHRQGVGKIALTSHFHCETESPEQFLQRREQAFFALQESDPFHMTLKRGCEVFFSPQLLQIDPRCLCLEGTPYLLLELPILQKPAFLEEVLTGLLKRGIVPVIAHAERYAYVRRDPGLLKRWISLGALIQVNAASLREKGRSFVLSIIRCGLVHVLSSDAHNARWRPADLGLGLQIVAKRVCSKKANTLERNALRIFTGQRVPVTECRLPRKFLGLWL